VTAEPRWISKKALLFLHEESLAEFGGARGLRDVGLLDSALARPKNTYAYNAENSIADLVASYGYGLAKNRSLVDGNKRAAFPSMGLFLAINGYQLRPNQMDAIQTMFAIASGELNEQGLSSWIAKNSISTRRPRKTTS
jgi:death-on-curing protein